MKSKVRTRFAPSPTGALHAGTVRTALFAWLTARNAGGQFLLRIEDTDKSREVEEGIKNITDSLKYLGLEWDEGPDVGGSHAPYVQSQRLDIYKEWAEKLVKAGRAYADPTTEEELDKLRAAAKSAKKPFLYRENRPENPPEWKDGLPLRFKSEPKNFKWYDEVMGDLEAGPEVIDDFILLKSDGFPTYNFAHIVDDHLMEISHVVRSQEFLSSVPKYLDLYEALGFDRPALVTVPLVVGADGRRKLSKREGAKQLLDYKKMGVLPEALMNALATTGWNDGTEQEIFSRQELIEKFSLDHIQKSGAHFDEDRLLWLNGQYIRDLKADELAKLAEPFWGKAAASADIDYRQKVLSLIQERLKYLAELPELTAFFFETPADTDIVKLYKEPVDKQLKKGVDYPKFLKSVTAKLESTDFKHDAIQTALNELLDELQTKPAVLFPVIRIAVSGSSVSPEIFGTLEVLGKTESLKRLNQALALLEKSS